MLCLNEDVQTDIILFFFHSFLRYIAGSLIVDLWNFATYIAQRLSENETIIAIQQIFW